MYFLYLAVAVRLGIYGGTVRTGNVLQTHAYVEVGSEIIIDLGRGSGRAVIAIPVYGTVNTLIL